MTVATRKLKTATRPAPAPHYCGKSPTSAHHWFIDRCRGEEFSPGVCEYCGKIDKFPNYISLAQETASFRWQRNAPNPPF